MESILYINDESKIVKKIQNIQQPEHQYTEATIRTKLNFFKKCMYYCSCDLFNPMFFSYTRDSLDIADELIYIHRLMYQFLSCDSHKFLSFDRLDTFDDYRNLPIFEWNIPDSYFSLVAAYILASLNCSSATVFFQKIAEELSKFIPDYAKFSLEKYLNDYLGKQYFLSLEYLFKKYTNSTHPTKHLRNCTLGLSSLLIECPPNNVSLRLIIYSLLEEYKKSVDNYISTLSNQKDYLDMLYPHDEPYILQIEKDSFQTYFNELKDISSILMEHVETSLKSDSKSSLYGIAVNDFNKYERLFQTSLTNFNLSVQEILEKVGSFYTYLLSNPYIKEKISSNRLKFNEQAAIKKIEPLYGKIKNYLDTLTPKFTAFFKQVQKASSENPSHYNSLKLNTNYLALLEDDVQQETDKLEKEFNKNIPVFSKSCCGYLKEQGYCNNSFSKEETLNLLNQTDLIEDTCLNSLTSKLLQCNYHLPPFPLTATQMIRLLTALSQ